MECMKLAGLQISYKQSVQVHACMRMTKTKDRIRSLPSNLKLIQTEYSGNIADYEVHSLLSFPQEIRISMKFLVLP